MKKMIKIKVLLVLILLVGLRSCAQTNEDLPIGKQELESLFKIEEKRSVRKNTVVFKEDDVVISNVIQANGWNSLLVFLGKHNNAQLFLTKTDTGEIIGRIISVDDRDVLYTLVEHKGSYRFKKEKPGTLVVD